MRLAQYAAHRWLLIQYVYLSFLTEGLPSQELSLQDKSCEFLWLDAQELLGVVREIEPCVFLHFST